jgi:hypothetical protein
MVEERHHPAGWHRDPLDVGQLRYWDGTQWTAHVVPVGPALFDPAPANAPTTHDLAANRPGQAAREQAVAAREAAPVKSFLGRALGIHTQERAWRVGADGEEEVARRLATLEGWHTLHAIPVGQHGADIDHLVVGPGGVYSLNTKNHSRSKVWVAQKAILVNGQRTDYLRNSRFEGKRATKRLSAACGFLVPVEPVIVVLAAELTVRSQPLDVHVVGRKQIAKWLAARPVALAPALVSLIYEQARLESTWVG